MKSIPLPSREPFSSVVPPLNSTILRAVEKVVGIRPLLVGPGIKTGINILMDNPKTLGSDLIVDVAAAIHEHPLPLVVIDMGTATTMSVADKHGNYIGGVILPGLRVSLNSLSGKTAQLPYISLEVPDKVIGKNTIDCMRAGIIFSNVDMIDGLLDRMEKSLAKLPPSSLPAVWPVLSRLCADIRSFTMTPFY